MIRRQDAIAAAFLSVMPAAMAAFLFFSGRCVYWGDLTYLHHPWRALVCEYAQRGMLPLWNPYVYFGMPLAAEMQSAAWYPGSIPFYLFPFEGALALFHALHFALAGVFAFLWLRREGLSRTASMAGAAVFMGSGSLVSRIPFLNHLSCLAYIPALLLFRSSPGMLGLGLTLCFLGGYPTIAAGGAVAAMGLPLLAGLRRRPADRGWKSVQTWIFSGAFAVGAGACLLLPATALAMRTHRGGGLDLAETLRFGLAPSDWAQWISPLLVPRGEFSAATLWWKDCYLGIGAWAAVFLAAIRLKFRVTAGLAVYIGLATLLVLGDSTKLSLWIWSHCAPLRYIRYPGNLAFLVLPAFAFGAAAGLHGRRWSGVFAIVVALELMGYAAVSQPTMTRGFFTDAGPLAPRLQASLEGHRYLLSGKSLQASSGFGATFQAGVLDWKHRLYGLTNIPFHLASAGNFGEPLVPEASYDLMDFLYRRRNLDALAPYLPWADVRFVLTRDRLPAAALEYEGSNLWQEYRLPEASPRESRAYWFGPKEGAALPGSLNETGIMPDFRKGEVLRFESPRADRYQVRGKGEAGWAYVSQPRDGDWKCRLNGSTADVEPAFGVFEKIKVPGGRWDFNCRYNPPTWNWGLWITVLVLLGTSAYWYNRISEPRNEFRFESTGR